MRNDGERLYMCLGHYLMTNRPDTVTYVIMIIYTCFVVVWHLTLIFLAVITKNALLHFLVITHLHQCNLFPTSTNTHTHTRARARAWTHKERKREWDATHELCTDLSFSGEGYDKIMYNDTKFYSDKSKKVILSNPNCPKYTVMCNKSN